jgi:eukaryotic-like serine/threonine-protein kinase
MSEHTTPPRSRGRHIASRRPPSFGGAHGRRYVPLAELGPARYDAFGVLMREIWRYRDVENQRDVAVKLIPTAGRGESLAHVEHGGAALAADAPGVAVMLDHVLVDEGKPEERLALISQFVTGTRLDELGPSGNERAVQLARTLAGNLAALHAAGVVHGDVKPSNVIVRETDGQPILVDAGSARRPGQRLLASSRLWEPPEAGDAPVATTEYDCWSLGLVIAALIGFRPVPEETPEARGRRAAGEAAGPLAAPIVSLLRSAATRASAGEAHAMLDPPRTRAR